MTLESLVQIARKHMPVEIDPKQMELVKKASLFVKEKSEGDVPVYGINTGFGHLAHIKIDKKEVNQLQENLLKSHACGVGEPLDIETVRAMMALRINALIKGYSGIRLETILKMVEFLNDDIIPVVFEKGSLGASGDLALLSHMSLPLIGLGEVYYQGERMTTQEALKKAGKTPIDHLRAKEGLSLINGTQGMTAIGGLVLYDAYHVLRLSNLALSLSMEALEGVMDAMDDRVHRLRGQRGQITVAEDIRTMLCGSQYTSSCNEKRVQDAYSLRCAPQVHGASKDAMDHVKMIVENEMNAVTDNPIVFADDRAILSAGNFHGQPLALAFDYLGIAIAELASISERRIERMVNPHLSNGLPPFLTKSSGLNSGFMIVQYTAASLVSENKVLAHPASVDSIPSSANQEDHVSMGSISARKSNTILDHAIKVISMELLTACQAVDYRIKRPMGQTTQKAYQIIREHIPFIETDVIMYPYLNHIEKLVMSQAFIERVFN